MKKKWHPIATLKEELEKQQEDLHALTNSSNGGDNNSDENSKNNSNDENVDNDDLIDSNSDGSNCDSDS